MSKLFHFLFAFMATLLSLRKWARPVFTAPPLSFTRLYVNR